MTEHRTRPIAGAIHGGRRQLVVDRRGDHDVPQLDGHCSDLSEGGCPARADRHGGGQFPESLEDRECVLAAAGKQQQGALGDQDQGHIRRGFQHLQPAVRQLSRVSPGQRQFGAKGVIHPCQRCIAHPFGQRPRCLVVRAGDGKVTSQCRARRQQPVVVPTREGRPSTASDPIDLREFTVDLPEVAQLERGIDPPQVTPQCGDRLPGGVAEFDGPAAECQPLNDRRRNGDRQMTGRDRLQDGLRVAGFLGRGQRLRSQLGGVRSTAILCRGDGSLGQQSRAEHRVGHPGVVQRALAQSANHPVDAGGTDPVNDQPGLGDEIRPSASFGEFRCRTATVHRFADVGVVELCAGQLDGQLRQDRVGDAGSTSLLQGEHREPDGLVERHCAAGLGGRCAGPARTVIRRRPVRSARSQCIATRPAASCPSMAARATAHRRCHRARATALRSA